jgi:hypothetical protein
LAAANKRGNCGFPDEDIEISRLFFLLCDALLGVINGRHQTELQGFSSQQEGVDAIKMQALWKQKKRKGS